MTTPLNQPAPIFTPTQLDDDGKMFSIHLSIHSCEPTIHCGWIEFNNEFQTWGITGIHNISEIVDRDFPSYDEAEEALLSSLEPVLPQLIKMIIERDRYVKSKRGITMKIRRINLTQHTSTPEQGCFEPTEKKEVQDLLTFQSLPSKEEINDRANRLAMLATREGADTAMIGGAPYLMSVLEIALKTAGVTPVYSFTERVSEETTAADGSVTKTNVFKHVGWVKV